MVARRFQLIAPDRYVSVTGASWIVWDISNFPGGVALCLLNNNLNFDPFGSCFFHFLGLVSIARIINTNNSYSNNHNQLLGIYMKIVQKQHLPRSLICAAFLLAGSIVSAQAAAVVPEDPNTFLTFLERYVPEDAVTATA